MVPFLDLKAAYERHRSEIDAAIRDVLEKQAYCLGPAVEAFERDVEDYLGAAHAIGVSSGTDAILIALMELGAGPGDEVITSAYSFFSTASSILRVGARPVFADIDPVTFLIDSDAIARAVTPRTKAIIPVHLYGRAVEIEAIRSRTGDLPIIEDAAQALGATHRGRRAGTMGRCGCFSFYPSKNLGAFGDAGMIVTSDPERAHRFRMMRVHGDAGGYDHRLLGINARLDGIQAAVLRVKLRHLDEENRARRENASRYGRLFAESGLTERIRIPRDPPEDVHVWHQYVVRAPSRDALRAYLTKCGISTMVYYPRPLHRQGAFEHLGYGEGSLPESEQAAREVLALPISSALTPRDQDEVVEAIRTFYRGDRPRPRDR